MINNNIMCTSEILTDLCFTKQEIKTKNGFVEVVNNVLVVKHNENCLSINGIQSVN